jgi:aspartate dehydrogenase
MTNSKAEGAAEMRVAIAGLGAIGKALALKLDSGGIPGFVLTAVCAKNIDKAAEFVRGFAPAVAVVGLGELGKHADIVIECAPAELLPQIAEPLLRAQKKLIVLSVGALLSNDYLVKLAADTGGTIIVPTGALIGLDAVIAAAEGTIHSVRMVTRKPPKGLAGAPYLLEHNIDISDLKAPLKVFTGNAREAARGFPANLNVVVALALAGIGPEKTVLEIWADPSLTRNVHRIEVDSDSALMSMTIENIPSENPKTGKITARSVIALLRKMTAPLRVGT